MTEPLQAGADHAELLRIAVEALEAIRSADIHHEGDSIDDENHVSSRVWIGPYGSIAKKALRQIEAPVLPDRGWRPGGEAVARIFAEDVLEQAERLLVCPADHESPGMWRDRVRRAAFLALPDAPAEGAE